MLAELLAGSQVNLVFNEFFEEDGAVDYREACKLGCDGVVSKRLGSPYRSGRSRHWIKVKNPEAPAVKREAEEHWGSAHWRRSKPEAASRGAVSAFLRQNLIDLSNDLTGMRKALLDLPQQFGVRLL